MTPLRNSRHEAFARLLVQGKSQAEAYRELFPRSRHWKMASIHPKASHLADKVRTRVAELQAEVAKLVLIEKAEALSIMADILRAAPANVKSDSRFAQEMTADPVSGKVTIRLPSKIAAFSELAKALGWYEPERIQQDVRIAPDPETLMVLGVRG